MNETAWTPQTRLLRVFLATADEARVNRFKDDLKVLLDFLPDLTDALITCTIEAHLTPTSREESEVVERFIESRRLQPNKAVSAVRVAAFLLQAFTSPQPPQDSTDLIASDLIGSHLIPASCQEKIRQFLASLDRATHEQRSTLLKRRVRFEGAAILRRVEITPLFAGIFDKRLEVGHPLSEYTPICEDLLPLGIIKLRLEESSVPYVSFQADERTIDLLIADLEALRKELQSMKQYLSVTGHTKPQE